VSERLASIKDLVGIHLMKTVM